MMISPNDTVQTIRNALADCDRGGFESISRALQGDTRTSVNRLLASCARRLDALDRDAERVGSLYAFEESFQPIPPQGYIVGLDEVGRGPLAGPLVVGAVVLERGGRIGGIDDSKRIAPARREALAIEIKDRALAYALAQVEPQTIDELGMAKCLRMAFADALGQIERTGLPIDTVLIDGNPLHIDPREHAVIKGDARCATIACASIIAKVYRDNLMVEYAREYPLYSFDSSKGYGSSAHIDAIRAYGLTPLHRKTFCTRFV